MPQGARHVVVYSGTQGVPFRTSSSADWLTGRTDVVVLDLREDAAIRRTTLIVAAATIAGPAGTRRWSGAAMPGTPG